MLQYPKHCRIVSYRNEKKNESGACLQFFVVNSVNIYSNLFVKGKGYTNFNFMNIYFQRVIYLFLGLSNFVAILVGIR